MIILDIETTSLDRNFAQLINIGAVHYETGKEFYRECRPDFSMPLKFDDATTKIHGVDKQDWLLRTSEKYSSQKEAAVAFMNYCLAHDEKQLLCGHNLANFDVMILHRILDGTFDMTWPLGYRFLDIHSMTYQKFGRSMGSKEIAEALEIPPEVDNHTGISGALHEYEVVKMLLEDTEE